MLFPISNEDISVYNISSPIYRNRRIGDFLKELHLIEGRNTGYPTVLKALRENGSSFPKFNMDDNRTFLSVTLPIHSYFLTKSEINPKELEYRDRIFSALKGKTLSMNELAKAMGYKGISAKLSTTIERLLECGALGKVMIGAYAKLYIPDDV